MTRGRPLLLAFLIAAGLIAFPFIIGRGLFNGVIGVGMRDAKVIKVCRDGTLVTQINEHYFVVRPDASRGWPATTADVCAP
jgi:hypothetical protein